MCACVSIQPGITVNPVRSYVVPCADGSSRAILPLFTTMAVFARIRPVPSRTVVALMTTGPSCAHAAAANTTTAASIRLAILMLRLLRTGISMLLLGTCGRSDLPDRVGLLFFEMLQAYVE